MAEEFFDVVNTNDEVIDRKSRSEVHRLQLLHRAVHVFVFRPDGDMLIHKRSPVKEEFPNVWTSSCSGHVSAGESYDETAPRELFEELGLHAAVTRLQKFDACEDTSFEFTVLYQAFSDDVVEADPGEITEVRWLPVHDIRKWLQATPDDFSPAFRMLFLWYVSNGVSSDSTCNALRHAAGDDLPM